MMGGWNDEAVSCSNFRRLDVTVIPSLGLTLGYEFGAKADDADRRTHHDALRAAVSAARALPHLPR